MLRESVRKSGALLLLVTLWFGAVVAVPMSAAAQTNTADKSSADKDAKQDDKTKAQTATDAHKPLSPKEDPAMIGKRKINSGSDKLFGWLGGSQEKEVALGRQLALEVEQQAKLVEDPMITEYINRVGQNVVLHSDAKIPFTIKVIDSDEVNAFALPGGFFFVNKGLILAADNEAEVAGVMAHEIAHVCARHAVENQAKGNALQLGALIGSIFLGGIPGLIYQNTAGILAGL